MADRCANCGKVIKPGSDLCPQCSSKLDNEEISGRYSAPPGKPISSPPPRPPRTQSSAKAEPIVLEGKYRLLDEIGRGAMGTVFRAMDNVLERLVAVKFLRPEYNSKRDYRDRFKKEAIAMARIHDPNVVRIYTYGEDAGTTYFVMEYLEGRTVESAIDAHNRRGFFIPLQKAVDMLDQTAAGLSAIHRTGVVHRDVKPGNIIVTEETERAVIMDFGLVRQLKDPRTEASHNITGTPAYIAPELVQDTSEKSDAKHLSDIYSLGATAYEVITGSIPFGGDSWVEILRRHLSDVPVLPSVRRPGLPEAFDSIILQAMDKDPVARYESADDFREDLLSVDIDEAVQHTSSPPYSSIMRRGSSSSRLSKPRLTPTGSSRSTPRSTPGSRSTPHGVMRSTPGYHGRLLVIDPDAGFRDIVLKSAKAAVPGSRIISAGSGAEAVEIIERNRPDVVLLEMDLPEANGLEVCASIKGDEGTEDVEIIVATGDLKRRERQILQGMGVRYFLTKPVDPHVLAEVLRPLLEKR